MKNKNKLCDLEQKLQDFKYLKIEFPQKIFNCLENLESSYDAILINNPSELNLTILQSNFEEHFNLGFDDEIESNGIIPVNNHAGQNMLGLSASTILIFKNIELANHFIKRWFNNANSNFFNFGNKIMRTIKCKRLTASAVIGLNKGYSDKTVTDAELKSAILKTQQMIKSNKGILLSVKLTQCEILFLGQEELSATIDFINYPKFPNGEEKWKDAVILFIKNMMTELEQNRTVVVFHDETMMLENSEEIDPDIICYERN